MKKSLFLSFVIINVTGYILLFPLQANPAQLENSKSTTVSKALTLEKSIYTALKNNSDIQFAYQDLLNARAKFREEKAKVKPALKAGANYVKSEGPDELLDFNEAKLTLTQPIYTGGRLLGSIKQAEANLTIDQQDYERVKQDVVFEVKKTYYEILKTKRTKEIIIKHINQLRAHLDQIKKRYEAGSAIKFDVMMAEAELFRTEQDLIKVKNTITLTKINFNKLLGRNLRRRVEVADITTSLSFQMKTLDDYLREAYANRPEIKKEQAELTASQMDVTIVKSQRFPQVELSGSYGYSGKNTSLDRDWRGVISIDWPLWDWGEINNKAEQAEAILRQKKITVKDKKSEITEEVITAYFSLKGAKQEMFVSKSLLKASREAYRIAKIKYETGSITNAEFLDAQKNFKNSEIDYYHSLYDYNLTVAELEKAVGKNKDKTES